MGLKNRFALGFLMAAILIGCAGVFPYKYYGLNADSYKGTLMGPKEADDIPLSQCQPDDAHKGKCVVMLKADFYKAKLEYLDMQERLKACESVN